MGATSDLSRTLRVTRCRHGDMTDFRSEWVPRPSWGMRLPTVHTSICNSSRLAKLMGGRSTVGGTSTPSGFEHVER